jgi:hypothetical protein
MWHLTDGLRTFDNPFNQALRFEFAVLASLSGRQAVARNRNANFAHIAYTDYSAFSAHFD